MGVFLNSAGGSGAFGTPAVFLAFVCGPAGIFLPAPGPTEPGCVSAASRLRWSRKLVCGGDVKQPNLLLIKRTRRDLSATNPKEFRVLRQLEPPSGGGQVSANYGSSRLIVADVRSLRRCWPKQTAQKMTLTSIHRIERLEIWAQTRLWLLN